MSSAYRDNDLLDDGDILQVDPQNEDVYENDQDGYDGQDYQDEYEGEYTEGDLNDYDNTLFDPNNVCISILHV